VACGLADVAMTSLARESGGEGIACFRKRVAHAFCQAHGRRQRLVTPPRLGIERASSARRAAWRAPINTSPHAGAEAVPA